MNIKYEELEAKQNVLSQHQVYHQLSDLDALRTFMKYHAFAVWDFMSLLKALQLKLTCVEVPWRPAAYSSEIVRFINEIVVGEESDLDADGNPNSHFEMYIEAMEEIGADTGPILDYVQTLNPRDIPAPVRPFVEANLDTAKHGSVQEVISSFFFGRENLVPDMFDRIVDSLENSGVPCKKLKYYLVRHIELDGDEHGPMARRCLQELCPSPYTQSIANRAGFLALERRGLLWDAILEVILHEAGARSASTGQQGRAVPGAHPQVHAPQLD